MNITYISMYKALVYAAGYGMVIRASIILFQDLNSYINYGIRPLPFTTRRFFRSKTLPICFLVGFLRYQLNEPIGDYLIRKYYFKC